MFHGVPVVCHMSHVMCHLLPVTCQYFAVKDTWRVTRKNLHKNLKKFIKTLLGFQTSQNKGFSVLQFQRYAL